MSTPWSMTDLEMVVSTCTRHYHSIIHNMQSWGQIAILYGTYKP